MAREKTSPELAEWQMDWFENRLNYGVLQRLDIRERLVRNANYPCRIRRRGVPLPDSTDMGAETTGSGGGPEEGAPQSTGVAV